jgi:hypothetical protein
MPGVANTWPPLILKVAGQAGRGVGTPQGETVNRHPLFLQPAFFRIVVLANLADAVVTLNARRQPVKVRP